MCYREQKKPHILQNTSILRSFIKKKQQIHDQIIYGNAYCHTFFSYINNAQ